MGMLLRINTQGGGVVCGPCFICTACIVLIWPRGHMCVRCFCAPAAPVAARSPWLDLVDSTRAHAGAAARRRCQAALVRKVTTRGREEPQSHSGAPHRHHSLCTLTPTHMRARQILRRHGQDLVPC